MDYLGFDPESFKIFDAARESDRIKAYQNALLRFSNAERTPAPQEQPSLSPEEMQKAMNFQQAMNAEEAYGITQRQAEQEQWGKNLPWYGAYSGGVGAEDQNDLAKTEVFQNNLANINARPQMTPENKAQFLGQLKQFSQQGQPTQQPFTSYGEYQAAQDFEKIKDAKLQARAKMMGEQFKGIETEAAKYAAKGGDPAPIYMAAASRARAEGERTNNPYILDMVPYYEGLAGMKPVVTKKVGKEHDTEAVYTSAERDMLLKDPNTPEYVKKSLLNTPADNKLFIKKRYDAEGNLVGTDFSKNQSISISGIGPGRMLPAFNKLTQQIEYVGANEIEAERAKARKEGREPIYAPASQQMKANSQEALVADIQGSINQVRASLKSMPVEFNAKQRAQLALVFKERDPKSAWDNAWGSTWVNSLTKEQQDYVTDVMQLREQMLGMRQLLGAGQGAKDMRAAILQTIPGAITGSKEHANMQLDKAEQVLKRISRGIARGALRPEEPETPKEKPASVSQNKNFGVTVSWAKTIANSDAKAKDLAWKDLVSKWGESGAAEIVKAAGWRK